MLGSISCRDLFSMLIHMSSQLHLKDSEYMAV